MSDDSRFRHQQNILARDLLSLALDKWDDRDIMERVSDYFFSLSMIFEMQNSAGEVDWHRIFTLLDTQYAILRGESTVTVSPRSEVGKIYQELNARIDQKRESRQ